MLRLEPLGHLSYIMIRIMIMAPKASESRVNPDLRMKITVNATIDVIIPIVFSIIYNLVSYILD